MEPSGTFPITGLIPLLVALGILIWERREVIGRWILRQYIRTAEDIWGVRMTDKEDKSDGTDENGQAGKAQKGNATRLPSLRHVPWNRPL